MTYRRAGVALATLVLLTVTARGDHASTIPRIGFVSPSAKEASHVFDEFRRGLTDLGYVDGKNVAIEARFAAGQYERFPEIFADLIRHRVDVIAIVGAVTATAANKQVTGVPVVFAMVVDPIAVKAVTNMQHPGGNITGITTFDPQQPRKQLQLLKQVVPGITRVAILGDSGVTQTLIAAAAEQARALGLEPHSSNLTAPTPDIDGAFAAMRRQHDDAVLMLEEPLIGVHRKQIVEAATKNRIPTVSSLTHADAGSVIAYSTSLSDAMRRLSVYTDKVLKGAKPGDMPVEVSNHYRLIVNLKAARDIGLTIPPEVLERADQVLQ